MPTDTGWRPFSRLAPVFFAILAAVLLTSMDVPASAYEVNDHLQVTGLAQMWITLYEQMEEAEGLHQHPSGDEATNATSGFSLHRARIGAYTFWFDRHVEISAQMRLERNPGLLDVYAGVHPARWLSIYFGQFKIPSSYEAMVNARDLDFILRTNIARDLADYSLSRTTYRSSLFYGVNSYYRDMGLGLKGDIDTGFCALRYFLMVGNGLGANLFISGAARREYIVTNKGQFFYGARLEIAEILDTVSVGGHFNYNKHDNIVFNSGRVVYDLNRLSYSGDLEIDVSLIGLRAVGMYGAGLIDDDYDDDGRTDLLYFGWESRLLWTLNPLISVFADSAFWERHFFEIGARFDRSVGDWNETGAEVTQNNWTFAVSYLFEDLLKVQLEYMRKLTDDPSMPELDDDILFIQIQGAL